MEATSSPFLSAQQFEEIFTSHVKVQTYPKPIKSIFTNDRKLKRINYKPYYQRNYVWDDDKATYFIESILLGTEIPPLIFFKEGQCTEIIDGRQRFETIKRFLDKGFSLSKNGLTSLLDLAKKDIESIRQGSVEIYQIFLDAKIRIIEFELVNHPPSDPALIDKLKKEIFGRYNSGITPLKRAEIDNAVYDSDELSNYFKSKLQENPDQCNMISSLFLRQASSGDPQSIEAILQFIRKSLVLSKFPIKHYAGGRARIELVKKFYEHIYEGADAPEPKTVYSDFIEKINLIQNIRNVLEKQDEFPTRLFWECLLWMLHVLEQEEKDYRHVLKPEIIDNLVVLFRNNLHAFDLTDSHYRAETLHRFSVFISFIEGNFNAHVSQYVQGDNQTSKDIADVRSNIQDSKTELEKLQSLRVTKPDPSRIAIEDIHSDMLQSRFLVRPSYQRSEVINLTKASALIESILLGILLPAIFIYKRADGVSEVIDGQQRLLTILGFIGKEYLDENNEFAKSKNNNFKLKDLQILTQLKGKGFDDLDDDLKDKILDFELLIVEIEERLNQNFNPVDLFIRLNDKPYPIKTNSFEMWNSWVDKEIIGSIKEIVRKNSAWFYIKSVNKENFRDRMLNEELLTILAFFAYSKDQGRPVESFLDIYQKGGRINARIKRKKNVTSLLQEVTEKTDNRSHFQGSITSLVSFIEKIKLLLHCDDDSRLNDELNHLLASGSTRRYYQRTFQDFYILWFILDDLSDELIIRPSTYSQIERIFELMKSIPENMVEGNSGYDRFINLISQIKS